MQIRRYMLQMQVRRFDADVARLCDGEEVGFCEAWCKVCYQIVSKAKLTVSEVKRKRAIGVVDMEGIHNFWWGSNGLGLGGSNDLGEKLCPLFVWYRNNKFPCPKQLRGTTQYGICTGGRICEGRFRLFVTVGLARTGRECGVTTGSWPSSHVIFWEICYILYINLIPVSCIGN